MANESSILAKMRAAEVPPHAFDKSLLGLNQKQFANIITTRAFDLEGGGLVSYIVRGAGEKQYPKVSLVCAVIAKELVLAQRQVAYVYLSSLMCSAKNDEPLNGFRGYLVVGDLGLNVKRWPEKDWDMVQDMLMVHLARGGGLIFGDTGAIDMGLISHDFANAISLFDEVRVA